MIGKEEVRTKLKNKTKLTDKEIEKILNDDEKYDLFLPIIMLLFSPKEIQKDK